MASEDFYLFSANQRIQQIDAQKAQALANLQQARATADYESAASSVQEIADLEAARENVQTLCRDYVQSQQPPQPEYLTPEERRVRPIEKCDWSDAVEIARTSRYARNIRPDDPNMIAGYYEAQRRRGRGE